MNCGFLDVTVTMSNCSRHLVYSKKKHLSSGIKSNFEDIPCKDNRNYEEDIKNIFRLLVSYLLCIISCFSKIYFLNIESFWAFIKIHRQQKFREIENKNRNIE